MSCGNGLRTLGLSASRATGRDAPGPVLAARGIVYRYPERESTVLNQAGLELGRGEREAIVLDESPRRSIPKRWTRS